MMISVNIYSHYKGNVRLNSVDENYWVVVEQSGGAELTIFVSSEDLQLRLAEVLRACFEKTDVDTDETSF